MNLRLRLFLAFLFTIALAVIVLGWYANQRTRTAFSNFTATNSQRNNQSFATFLEQRLAEDGIQAIPSFLDRVALSTDREVVLLDENGQALYSSPPPPPHNGKQPPPIILRLLGDAPNWQVKVFVPSGGNQPLNRSFDGRGGQQVHFDEVEQTFLGSVNNAFWLAGLIAVGIAGIFSLALAQRIITPIQSLTSAARQMQAGDLSQRVAIASDDEIGKLGSAFNGMATSLEQQEQLRRNMVSDIAHELRTPLTNIRGYLEAIQDGLVNPDTPTISSIHEEAMLLNRLVEDLQELSLAEAGQLRIDVRPVDLGEIVEGAVMAHRLPAQAKEITLNAGIPTNFPPISADPERIGQLLRNLLKNGITYTPKNGHIQIDLSTTADNQAQLRIADNGQGISPDDLPHVFDRFYRADKSRDRATGGAGLGLAIAKAIVEMHKGEIKVESALEQGTTFVVTLPFAE